MPQVSPWGVAALDFLREIGGCVLATTSRGVLSFLGDFGWEMDAKTSVSLLKSREL